MSHRVFRPKLPGISRVVAAASKLIADGRKPPRPRRLALEPLKARCLLASSSAGLGDFDAAFPTDVPAAAPALVARASEFGSVRVIVEVDEAASQATVAQRARAHGATIVHQYERFPMLVVEADAAGLEALLNAPQVVALVEDVADRPALNNSLPVIGAAQVHNLGWDGSGIAVAILDTGVDREHPFFSGRVVEEACYSSPGTNRTSLCPNGTSTQLGAGVASINTAACLDGNSNLCSHGSHVAGIAAGDGTGVAGAPAAGVAPAAQIIAIQVFTRFEDDASCDGNAPCVMSYTSDQIRGLERVLELSESYTIAAANMSIGGSTGYSSPCDSDSRKTVIDKLRSANVATVIAAGNDAYPSSVSAPACISTAIAVGSTSNTDTVSSFTNRGPLLDLFAPGQGIVSAVANGGFAAYSGTSMATPHVAGAWAVLRQANPALSVSEILTLLQDTGVPIRYASGGTTVTTPRIDLLAAVLAQAGRVDHFAWEPLSDQFADVEFPVTITARNSQGATITQFQESASLYGYTGTAGEVVAIGTGTGAWELPLNTSWHDSRTQTIYLQHEIGAAMTISGLALDVAVPPGQTLGAWTIRMKHTALSSYARASLDATGWTTVFQADETVSSAGWIEFVFTTPFEYNGSDNLMIDFSHDNASASTTGQTRFTAAGTTRTAYARSASRNGDPLTWSGRTSPNVSGSVNVPNVRLLSPSTLISVPMAPTLTGNFVDGVGTGGVTVQAPASGVYLRVAAADGQVGDSNRFAVRTPPSLPSVVAVLAPDVGAAEAGQTSYRFAIEFADDEAIAVATLDGGDVRVTGPHGFLQPAEFVSVTPPDDGSPRTATYQMTPPGGHWDEADNGDYSIGLNADQVFNLAGHAVPPAALLATFTVNVPPGGTLEATLVDGTLTVTAADADHVANRLTVYREGESLVIAEAAERFGLAPPEGTLGEDARTLAIPLAWVTSLIVDLAGGDDLVTVDFAGGDPLPPGGMHYEGGDGHDALRLVNGAFASSRFNYDNAHEGHIRLASDDTGGEVSRALAYAGLETITSSLAHDLVELLLPGGSETIDVFDAGDGRTTAASTHGVATTFANPHAQLEIAATAATEVLAIHSLAHGYASLVIRGDDRIDLVYFYGPLVLAAGHRLTVAGVGTARLPESASEIAVSGGGEVRITAGNRIVLEPGARISASDGEINLSARLQGAPADDDPWAGILVRGATVAATGTIRLTADSIALLSAASIDAAAGAVVLRPDTAGTEIDLGGDDPLAASPAVLGLSAEELDRITAGTLAIGDAASGAITVRGSVTRSAATTVRLASGADVVFDGGSIDTGGGTLEIHPGGSLRPRTAGPEIAAVQVLFGDGTHLASSIGGTAVDTQYSQLNVVGTVELGNVVLDLTGDYVSSFGEGFTVVSADEIRGEFVGLAEGDTVERLGRLLQIQYTSTAVRLTDLGPAGGLFDFGDAPASYGTTGPNAARHALVPGGPFFGAAVDAEADGQPGPGADGDDHHELDDEDGIAFVTPLLPGRTASVEVDLRYAPVGGRVSAWIDFNRNGDFADAGEHILQDVAVTAGSIQTLSFSVPRAVVPGLSYARFRISTAGGLSYDGAAADGEVEDWAVLLAWQNPVQPLDVTGDGLVSPLDVLVTITEINLNGERLLPVSPPSPPPPPFYDVSGDGFLTALDVLQIVNYLNAYEASLMPPPLPEGLRLPEFDVLEANPQFVARMDLQPDLPAESHVPPAVGFIVQASGPVIVRDRDAVDDRLDPRALARDQHLVPHVLVVGVEPLPALRGMFRLGIGGRPHVGPQPDLRAPRFVVNEAASPGSGRMEIDLGTIEPAGLVVVPAADLYAAVARGRAVRLNLEPKRKVGILVLRQ